MNHSGAPPVPSAQPKRWKAFKYPPLRPISPPFIDSRTLPSGARVFLLTDREFPIVELGIRLPFGTRDEPPHLVGLCDILAESLRSGGSRRYPGDDLDVALDDIGASLDIDCDDDFFSISLFVLKEHLPEALAILTDLLEHPLFPENRIESARAQILGEILRRNDEPDQIVSREFQKIILGDVHPYARVPELYTVQPITRDDILSFYETHLSASGTLIGAAGDITVDELSALLDIPNHRKSLPAVSSPLPEPPSLSPATVHFVQKDGMNQSYIMMGHLGFTRNAPDYVAFSLWHRLLSGPALSGRLFSVVRTQMGLAYAVYSRPGAEYGYPGVFSAYAATRSEATLDCIRAIKSQIELLRDGNFTDEEFALARDATLNSFIFYYASPSQIVSRRLDYETYGYPPDFLEAILRDIPRVTREEATAAASCHIHPDHIQYLVVGDRSAINSFLEKIAPVVIRDISIPKSPPR
ncbi:MAG: M16 family metallopeptidase [bacterium JZ-2024 1]